MCSCIWLIFILFIVDQIYSNIYEITQQTITIKISMMLSKKIAQMK